MVEIKVKNYISRGFSENDAKAISPILDECLKTKNSKIIIDFKDVKYFTTLFFNLALTRYLENMSVEEYESKIEIKNLSEVGLETYSHSYDNAVEYYSLSPKEKEERENRISENTEMV